MNAQGPVSAIPTKVVEELVEVLRDFKDAVDPIGSMRPLSIADAAKVLRCRRSEVEKLIADGNLPHINRNGRRYILPSDIAQWLRNESKRERPRKPRRTTRRRLDLEDIDPALREFFA